MVTALFDMDGTLFGGDSQLRFARFILRRHPWRRLYLLFPLPCGMLRALHAVGTPFMKRAFLAYAWRMRREALESAARDFVQSELIPALYPELVERLEAHLRAGDVTVLCSASPDWWTQLVGRALGFTHTIGSPFEPVTQRVPLMPRLLPPATTREPTNCCALNQSASQVRTSATQTAPPICLCSPSVRVPCW